MINDLINRLRRLRDSDRITDVEDAETLDDAAAELQRLIDAAARLEHCTRMLRPRVWACIWPDADGCGGGSYVTTDERSASNYMYGAIASAERMGRKCRPELVPLYDESAISAAVAAERERLAIAVERMNPDHQDCNYYDRHIASMIRGGSETSGCRDCADKNGTCPNDGHKCGT